MKISYNWIGKYIHHQLSPQKLGEVLTSAGLEIEEITHFSLAPKGLEDLVVGHVKTVVPHPNADRLRLTTVDIGEENFLKIVCGAPNIAEGQKVIVAKVGALLHPSEGEPFTIKKSKIRGEESEGMICAEDEIGLGTSHEGVAVLKEDAKIGQAFLEYLNTFEDNIFEVSITPNRVDAASHIGAARDIAALIGTQVNYPAIAEIKNTKIAPELKIIIEDAEACPRYSGIIIKNIEVKDSPEWLQNSLRSIGLQPINNIVDVSNFVLHEMGHPLHAFDLSKIKGKEIHIKNAVAGTEFITLDKQVRKLDGSELMICNAEVPMALAGVFGGLESGINNTTKDIFIESAYFNPGRIRKTGRKHQLFTDASFRFERGADPNATIFAMLRAAKLIVEVSGGEIVPFIYDQYPVPIAPVQFDFDLDYLNKIAGIKIPEQEVKSILTALEIKIIQEQGNILTLEIPSFKIDVKRPIDVVEEVMRIYSFDKIPLPGLVKSVLQVDPLYTKEQLRKKLSHALVAHGFNEAFHLSFVNTNENKNAEAAVQVMNPISTDLEFVRDNMLKPGLKSIAYNMNRQQSNVHLFEWGHTYHAKEEGFYQNTYLSIWISGLQNNESWYNKEKKPVDFYYLKGICEELIHLSGVKIPEYKEIEDNLYEYAMKAGNILQMGKVSAACLKAADISKPVFYAEIAVESLLNKIKGKEVHYQAISRFPRMDRDLSLLVPAALKYDKIKEVIKKSGTSLLKDMFIFDVYQGEQVKQGFKSYSLRLEFEDKNETLEDKKVDKIISKIMENLEKELEVSIRI